MLEHVLQYSELFKSSTNPDWKVCVLRAEDIFPIKFARLEQSPCNAFTFVILYLSTMFCKFCAVGWPLRAWQFACYQKKNLESCLKIFSAHYKLSSLGTNGTACSMLHYILSCFLAISYLNEARTSTVS